MIALGHQAVIRGHPRIVMSETAHAWHETAKSSRWGPIGWPIKDSHHCGHRVQVRSKNKKVEWDANLDPHVVRL